MLDAHLEGGAGYGEAVREGADLQLRVELVAGREESGGDVDVFDWGRGAAGVVLVELGGGERSCSVVGFWLSIFRAVENVNEDSFENLKVYFCPLFGVRKIKSYSRF